MTRGDGYGLEDLGVRDGEGDLKGGTERRYRKEKDSEIGPTWKVVSRFTKFSVENFFFTCRRLKLSVILHPQHQF